MRGRRISALSLAAVLLAGTAIATPRPTVLVNAGMVEDVPRQRIYVRAAESLGASEERMIALRHELSDMGAVHVNLILPNTIVCEIGADANPHDFVTDPAFDVYREDVIGPAMASPAFKELEWIKRCYEEASRLATSAEPGLPSGFKDAVFEVPPDVVRASAFRQDPISGAIVKERTTAQNSEFMIGDILVQVVYPESQAGSENWADEEMAGASQGVIGAMLAYQQRFHYVPMSFSFRFFQRVPTIYEPIEHNMSSDELWISDVMQSLGYHEADALTSVHAFNNDGRKKYGTDWAYTAFVADSRNAPGHHFNTNNYTAYAGLGGPFLVIPYPAGVNDPNGLGEAGLFSRIYQHEAGHIFWALDEYPAAPGGCQSRSGYLNYVNKNKVNMRTDGSGTLFGCPNYVECMMWDPRVAQKVGRPVCKFTAGQIGTIDANENSVPDVFDKEPRVEFEVARPETLDPQTLATENLLVRFKVISQAVQNLNGAQGPEERVNYAAPLKDAELAIDGIGATRLKPLDGRWDEMEEEFELRFSGLSPGRTVVRIRGRNRFGLAGEATKQIFVIGLRYALFDVDVREQGIQVSWNTIDETFGAKMRLIRQDMTMSRIDTIATYDAPDDDETFHPFGYLDTDVVPGREYRYHVEGTFSLFWQGEVREFTTKSGEFSARAALRIEPGRAMSTAAPNPFRDRTLVTIDVPETVYSNPVGDDPSGAFAQTVPTRVTVTVFDALGRRVKTLFDGSMFGNRETFTWDGTNLRNEQVSSGIYFIKAIAGPVSDVQKVVIVR